jgi:hypothetical protein
MIIIWFLSTFFILPPVSSNAAGVEYNNKYYLNNKVVKIDLSNLNDPEETNLEAKETLLKPNSEYLSSRLNLDRKMFDNVELIKNYDFLIITPQEYESALEPLLTHKNNTAMPTLLITLEEIYEEYDGSDQPEQIKIAIADYQQAYNIKYVLLVGDTDKFPVRYIRAINTEWNTRFYPSDLYYADLYDDYGNFDDWDFDDDGFYGTTNFKGKDTASVNQDQINLKPDIAVGRVPVSTIQEVDHYVNKVIRYEFAAWRSDWAQKALVISDHTGKTDARPFSDNESATNIVNSLTNYQVDTMYIEEAPYVNLTTGERAAEVAQFMNEGLGFVAHLGHGDTKNWDHVFGSGDMTKLSNSVKLPIAYTIGCLTATFHFGYAWQTLWNSAEERYLTASGGVFDGRYIYKTNRPMPAAVQPAAYDADSLVEDILVKYETGAIAYIGAVAKGEHGGKALQRYFVQELNDNTHNPKLGLMWMSAMRTFADNEAQPAMGHHYAYLHQHKVMLFGDPSLRVGGVSRIQKEHFLGDWEMVHDGWKGKLSLSALSDSPIESYYNLKGTYTDSQGHIKQVVGAVQTPNYLRGASWQDHQIFLKIDFNNNLDFQDDQPILAYLFTWIKNEMAGITKWGGMTFGVSIYRPGVVQFKGIRDGIRVRPEHLTGTYKMSHDGWQGTLKLEYRNWASIENMPEIAGEYIGFDGMKHKVYGSFNSSLPHVLTLFIDFEDTLQENDDSRFNLYLFTQTKEGMAGITHWHKRPFGVRLQRFTH